MLTLEFPILFAFGNPPRKCPAVIDSLPTNARIQLPGGRTSFFISSSFPVPARTPSPKNHSCQHVDMAHWDVAAWPTFNSSLSKSEPGRSIASRKKRAARSKGFDVANPQRLQRQRNRMAGRPDFRCEPWARILEPPSTSPASRSLPDLPDAARLLCAPWISQTVWRLPGGVPAFWTWGVQTHVSRGSMGL